MGENLNCGKTRFFENLLFECVLPYLLFKGQGEHSKRLPTTKIARRQV